MLAELGGLTGDVVSLALDAALVRHSVIANNIANNSTQGFVPQRVRFEDRFSEALGRYRGLHSTQEIRSRLSDVRPSIEAEAEQLDGLDTTVLLDREMARLAENTVRYQALLSGLSKRGGILAVAINGGRR